MNKQIITITLIILSLATTNASAVNVTINPNNEKWTISKHLTGMSFVYPWNADEIYEDGNVANWAKENKINTARYPGGTASYWNWENPTGRMGTSSLDPNWDGVIADPNKWMDIDEYLSFCSQSGMSPLMGVNYASCILHNFPVQESVDRAVRQVQHLKDRGYGGAFWYIGNEDLAKAGGRVPNAANLFAQHAQAMKAVDPNIIIFWNDNNANATHLQEHLAIVGPWADGVEFHGKWPYGGNPSGFGVATFEEWKTEVPIIDRKAGASGRTWREKIAELRTAAAAAGYPDLLMANNEYGLNGSTNKYSGFNKYTKGLVVVEFLQEMFIANYDMACFWATVKSGDHKLMDKTNNYRFNPMHFGFELLGPAQGQTMIDSNSSHQFVHGFAAKTPDSILLYLINKTESPKTLDVNFTYPQPDTTQAPLAQSMTDTNDHWGTLSNLTVVYDDANESFNTTLPALSYTRITFARIKGIGSVFDANFNDSNTEENTAAANLDLGTSVGSWSNFSANSHVRAQGPDKVLLIDRDAGPFAAKALFTAPIDLNKAIISFKAAIRRTIGNDSKNITVMGLDDAANKSFELVITANTTAGAKRRLAYMDPNASLIIIPQGYDNEIQYMDDTFDPNKLRLITLSLQDTGYTVNFNNGAWQSNLLAFNGSASQIAKIQFSGSNDAGVWLDDINAYSPKAADLNRNRSIDFQDLKIMSLQWLQTPAEPNADIAPPGSLDNFVNFYDFELLCRDWL